MSDKSATIQAQLAFRRARSKAFLHDILAALQGRPNRLLAYDEVRKKLKASHPIYRGLKSVPLDRIVGSVDRYRDFDRAFMPSQDFTRDRWQRVGRAYYGKVDLPPVELYQVGDLYFVADGNHRVSVARELGQEFIDAIVRECRVRVPLTTDLDPQDLEIIGEQIDFLAQTHLDEIRPAAQIAFTFPGGYYRLLEHIEAHRYMQSQEWQREFSFEEAVGQWFDQVYMPVVQVIRETGILQDFPGRTEADLYLWVIEHRYYLRERFGDRIGLREAARSFAAHFTPRILKRLWTRITAWSRKEAVPGVSF